MRVFRLFLVCFALSTRLCGQSGFILPIKHKVALTGNYAELRPNHFHAGLDFKTHPKLHLPIYAIGDGYVSRIKVGTHGYGKVLYITHPNGKVSVYGHQYSFNDSIKGYVQAAQDMLETFEVELFPRKDELKVKQGEIIGYTGNTGDSEGPHLHFEIRDEKSEVPLNPLRFISVPDTVRPSIRSIAIYEEDHTLPRIISIRDTTDTLRVPIKMGVGVECFDLETAKGNSNNIHSIELLLDDTIYQRIVLDSIAFDMARYVNTYGDYALRREKKIKMQKTFLSKHNDLPVYKSGHTGFLYLEDTAFHELKIRVKDYYGQQTTARFTIQRVAAGKMAPIVFPPVNCLEPWSRSASNYRIEMLEKTLYKDVLMTDSMRGNVLYFQAKDYQTPLHKSCILSMKASPEFEPFGDKLCIVDGSGSYYTSNFEKGWVNTTTKSFGQYTIVPDTAAPKIRFIKPNSKKRKFFKTGDQISFRVSDDLSGVGNFKMYVNDKFQLAEYEHKTGLIFFEITDKTPRGKINVRLELSDRKNNKSLGSVYLDIN